MRAQSSMRVALLRSSSCLRLSGLPVLISLLVCLLSVNALAQTAANLITSLSGDVEVVRGGNSIKASKGFQVQVGDRIKTGPNSNATVTLSDGSTLELGESGDLTLDQHTLGANGATTTRVGLLTGALRSTVAKVAGATAPDFEVHTPNAVGAARGTVYDMDHQNGVVRKEFAGCEEFSDVSVYEGDVEVSNVKNPGAGTVDVPAGKKAVVACGLIPVIVGAAAAGTGIGTAAAAAGGVAATGGVVGGLTAGLSGGGSNPPASPSQ